MSEPRENGLGRRQFVKLVVAGGTLAAAPAASAQTGKAKLTVWTQSSFTKQADAAIKGLYDPGDENGRTRASGEHRGMMYDVDFQTGKIRWEHELARGVPKVQRHIKNSYASETPVTDGERIYAYFGSVGLLAALDLNGRRVWMQELGAYDGRQAFGTAASPAVHGDRVIVVHDNATESFMAAYDKRHLARHVRAVHRATQHRTPSAR